MVTNSFPIRYVRVSRQGLTLIEVLIATTITLLMMLAMAQGFKSLSQTVSEGRSMLNLSDQLRGLNQLLRNDFAGRTTDSATPQSGLLSSGYFKYYDGPISDSTAALFNHLPLAATLEERLSASRWGDIDDIVMFTAKAKPGQVFRGKIPQALLIINAGFTPTAAQWSTDVTISSEYAEIVWFMMPLNEFNSIDPTNGNNMVVDTNLDGMPDRLALCRRVLLIRPDLNITPTAAMFGNGAVAVGDYLTMQPLAPTDPTDPTYATNFRFMMQNPYQRCDLSVRPHLVSDVSSSYVSIKTNSIEDLQLPQNRFAHYGFPIGTSGTLIPTLALTTENLATAYTSMTNLVFSTYTGINPAIASFQDRGFLPAPFMRTKPIAIAGGGFSRQPLLEEIVASNVVAFDLKGFDTSVKQLAHPGADGSWGDFGVNDDGVNLTDDRLEAGWPGTDDFALTPSDAGYAIQLIDIANGVADSEVVAGAGAFVDAGWGSKVFSSIHPTIAGSVSMTSLNAIQRGRIVKYFPSSLSLVDVNLTLDDLIPATTLYDSGSRYINTSLHQTYQPAFDTFTTSYEYDGEAVLRTLSGLVWQEGTRRFGGTPPRGGLDPAVDGVGNDSTDRDVIPQIPYKMPSIQATIRVQDYTAGTLQQISVVHDLTN